MYKSCVLISENKKFHDVTLQDGTTSQIGRSAETGIKHLKCSKKHISATADYSRGIVEVFQAGSNPSYLGNQELRAGDSSVLRHGESLHLLKNLFKYTAIFTKNSNSGEGKNKRKRSEDVNTVLDDQTETNNTIAEEKRLRLVQQNLSRMQSSLKNFFPATEVTKKEPTKIAESTLSVSQWSEAVPGKLFIFKTDAVQHSSKVACFDIDGTLITTKSGKVFPVNNSDWKLLFPQIPKKLKELSKQGFQIVLFTNQKGISRGNLKPSDFHQKLKDIASELAVPFQALVSSGSGEYRKPITGMWNYFQENCNGSHSIDMQVSFYVGDAAGRPANWEPKRKKDFSCSDRLFALNCDLNFFTPEEYFLQQKPAPFALPDFDPRKLKNQVALCIKPSERDLTVDEICQKPEVIVFVGFPAAGKSFFAKKYIVPKGYVHVNRDTLGSYQKCQALCESTLSQGGSVVVDNTNPDQESRKRFIDLAKKHRVNCRCFLFNCSIKQAEHNNTFRELTSKDHAPINIMILNSYKSKFQEPNLSEGFKEIVLINFVPCFENKKLEKSYKMFLTEK